MKLFSKTEMPIEELITEDPYEKVTEDPYEKVTEDPEEPGTTLSF